MAFRLDKQAVPGIAGVQLVYAKHHSGGLRFGNEGDCVVIIIYPVSEQTIFVVGQFQNYGHNWFRNLAQGIAGLIGAIASTRRRADKEFGGEHILSGR